MSKEIKYIHKIGDKTFLFETYEQPLRTQIEQLKQQLAEKDKEIEYQESMKILAVKNQNQKAIEELKLALDNFRNRPTYFDVARQELCLSEQDKQFIDFIDNRIKELGGGNV